MTLSGTPWTSLRERKMPRARGLIEVSLLGGADRKFTFKVAEGFGGDYAHTQEVLGCTPEDEAFSMAADTGDSSAPRVIRAGQRLYGVLSASRDASILFGIMSQTPPDGAPPLVFPLFVQLDASDAERLPWEVLWSQPPGVFRALHRRCQWTIARMAAGSGRATPLHRQLTDTVRIAIIAAAAEQDGTAEWERLAKAIDTLEADAEILVIVSEDAAQAAVNATLQRWQARPAGSPARVVTVMFAADSLSMISKLETFAPNILHVFCHGVAEPLPRLEIETRADRRRTSARGSIKIGASDLATLASTPGICLIVLNCCEGARPATNLHSIARDLVVSGAPVVVAMRESVDVVDANLFTSAFYSALLPRLKTDLVDPTRVAGVLGYYVDEQLWLGAMFAARQVLSSTPANCAETSPKWTLPVAYIHRDELRIVDAGAAKDTVAEREQRVSLDLMQQFRASLLALPARDATTQAHLVKWNEEIARVREQLGLPPETAAETGT